MVVIDYGAEPTRKQYRLSHQEKRNRIELGIIALDGEGKDISTEYQVYNLLYSSNGSYIESNDLSENPYRILDFLLELPKKPLKVMYAFDYDVTMWLRKLPRSTLQKLWKDGYCLYGQYRISYRPHHQFTVTKMIAGKKRSCTVWDVFRFYQQSFVASLFEWGIGSIEVRERIYNMKAERSNFANISDDKIREYCASECELLVEMVTQLLEATIAAGVKLSRYDGAGAIANSLMRDHNMAEYNAPLPMGMQDAILSAYYGGRTELAITGEIGHAYTYDINSAYPAQTLDLPCIKHLSYQHTNKWRNDTKWSLWHVQWNVDAATQWAPFPFRLQDGRITYPLRGSGWYWLSEVQTAMAIHGSMINVLQGYVLEGTCECMPFSWVETLYYHRQKLKSEGNAGQRVLKLGINALYGKTAQSIGNVNNPPKYTNFIWAGLITSGCRAKLYSAMMQKPDKIVSCATDGIISLEPLDVPVSKTLGEWESGEIDNLWTYQPGVASYETPDHPNVRPDGICFTCNRSRDETHITYKTRGFTPREIDISAMQHEYTRDPLGEYRYNARRFIGIGAGLQRTELAGAIGRWIDMPRVVNFCPSQRLPRFKELGSHILAWRDPILSGTRQLRVWPLSEAPTGQLDSAPYVPKMAWAERWDDDDSLIDDLIDLAQP